MKSEVKKVLNLIIILCVVNFYYSTATIFQRITYKNYIFKVGTEPVDPYHEIELEWADDIDKLPDLAKEAIASRTWLYSMKRSNDNGSSFISDQVNEYDFHFTNKRFKPYLFDINGSFKTTSNISDKMAYVAWDINPTCVSKTIGVTSVKTVKVSMNVRYFNCVERAKAFYSYFLTASPVKVLVFNNAVPSGYETTTPITINSQSHLAKNFLGFSYSILNICPV